jgi:hypothetical protein
MDGIESWKVDTRHKDKILSVKTTGDISEETITDRIASAGFKADLMQTRLFEKLFGK